MQSYSHSRFHTRTLSRTLGTPSQLYWLAWFILLAAFALWQLKQVSEFSDTCFDILTPEHRRAKMTATNR